MERKKLGVGIFVLCLLLAFSIIRACQADGVPPGVPPGAPPDLLLPPGTPPLLLPPPTTQNPCGPTSTIEPSTLAIFLSAIALGFLIVKTRKKG